MLSIRVEPTMKEAIERAAREDSRTSSSLVVKILADWLKANGYLPKP